MEAFRSDGSGNTEATLGLANDRARELGIRTVLVASTSGATGLEAAHVFAGRRVVVVSHSTGFSSPGAQEMPPDTRRMIEEAGAAVLTTTHAFGGVGRSVRRRFKTYQVDEIMAQTLRIFGQGTKVAIEIALMAADAGLAPIDEDVVSIGGTDRGADTALVIRPAHAQDFFEIRVREVICKPALC